MIQVLEYHGVRDFTVQPSLNTSLLEGRKLVLLNQFVRQLPATAWLIFADVDRRVLCIPVRRAELFAGAQHAER